MAKILIIDQDAHLTDLLNAYLTTQGFKVFVEHRGEDGMAQALKHKPDVILMDAQMPDATGFQMCNRFRQNDATQDTPIIMMSTLAHLPRQQQFAMERGANEVIPKPLKVFELGELVDKYVAYRIAQGISSDSPEAEKRARRTAGGQAKYNLATQIHRQLSTWLGRSLNAQEGKDSPQE